jgi:D-alanyl-D-alanine dipeptidase
MSKLKRKGLFLMKKRVIMYCLAIIAILSYLTGCQVSLERQKENIQQTILDGDTADVEPIAPSRDTEPTDTQPTVNCDVNKGEVKTKIESTEIDEANDVMVEIEDDVLVNIIDYIPNIVIDLKYATTDNFTGKQIYDTDMPAQVRYGTMKKLMEVQKDLNALGYTLVIWDAYRPTKAQFKLWDVCPNNTYVANPNEGFSSHSRGNTVDVTVQTLDGDYVEMPTDFDDFSLLANRDYGDVSGDAARNALLLENLMKDHGFKPYYGEWWHFSDKTSYPVIEAQSR